VLGEPSLEKLNYEARLIALKRAGVGLWDVIQSANRVGSLDSNIRDHQPHPLADFAAALPNLKAIAFNGGTASAIGRRQLAGVARYALIDLPSSSPAYTRAYALKEAAWLALRAHLTAPQTTLSSRKVAQRPIRDRSKR
jgi:TDG/mug DNA glycosylase family protein